MSFLVRSNVVQDTMMVNQNFIKSKGGYADQSTAVRKENLYPK